MRMQSMAAMYIKSAISRGEEYQTFIDEMVKNSDFDTGIEPKSTNKILTLSTCTDHDSSKRFAVHAVCIDTQKISEE
ncbi:sortase [Ruminococcus sp. AF25-3LB]|nr:sortase [Ruminococcus sp. AF25-3LB]